MRGIFKRLGKTGTAIATLLTIAGGILAFIPVVHSIMRKDIKGNWKITCTINSSTYKPYIGKSSGFRVSFTQDGDKLKGVGEMFWVNDQTIPFSQHVPIEMDGILDGDNVHITYVLHGARRLSSGTITLKILSDKQMSGVFNGTAASAKGVANAETLN